MLFHLAHALRGTWSGLTALGWVAALTAPIGLPADLRPPLLVGAALGGVALALVGSRAGRPPSLALADLTLTPALEREILAAARASTDGDADAAHRLAGRLSAHVTDTVRRTGGLPTDRTRWLQLLAERLAIEDAAVIA